MEHDLLNPAMLAQARRQHAGAVPGESPPMSTPQRGGYVGPSLGPSQTPPPSFTPPPGPPPPYVGPPGMNNFTEDQVNRVFAYPEGPERARAQFMIRSQMGG